MKGLRFSLTTMGTTLSLLALGATNPAESITLTSITLDPENATGQTTNAPGAYSTNTGDPLAQIGLFSTLCDNFCLCKVKCLSGKTLIAIWRKKLSV